MQGVVGETRGSSPSVPRSDIETIETRCEFLIMQEVSQQTRRLIANTHIITLRHADLIGAETDDDRVCECEYHETGGVTVHSSRPKKENNFLVGEPWHHTRSSSNCDTWKPRPRVVDKIEATLVVATDSEVWVVHINNGAQE